MNGVPFIAYGTPQDFTTYSEVNGPIVTYNRTDPYGGTNAVLVEDDNPSAPLEYIQSPSFWLRPHDTVRFLVPVWVKEGIADTGGTFQIDRNGGAVDNFAQSWSGGVPTFFYSLGTGAIARQPVEYLGSGGWWLGWGWSSIFAAGDNIRLRLYGATATPTGSQEYFWQPALLSAWAVDGHRGAPRIAAGSEFDQSAGGERVAWVRGTEYGLRARWQAIGLDDAYRAGIVSVAGSGWDGPFGFAAAIDRMHDKDAVRYHPDVAIPGSYYDVFLDQPEEGLVGNDDERLATVDFLFYSTTKISGLGRVQA